LVFCLKRLKGRFLTQLPHSSDRNSLFMQA
jgi:hypothetical protein